jgi:tRNA nucleotidyltransferase (CCA-adding enzyme)
VELHLPPLVAAIATGVNQAGGRAFLVGGGVRDHLHGRSVKDWDLEVFGLPGKALQRLLRRHGHVSTVGKAFGVYKLRAEDGLEVDVSIPRRDSKVGPGHRGIAVEGDPDMTVEEAVRRRDLTINALLLDLVTGEIVDPAGGLHDLSAGILRAVDAATFLEDPLRALRVVQFAARFDFRVDPELVALCAQAPLHELPAERILGEWVKLAVRGVRPSAGLNVGRATGILGRLFPEWVDAAGLDRALDHHARHLRTEPEGRDLAVHLAIWLSATDQPGALLTMDRLGLHRWDGFPSREVALAAHARLGAPAKTDAALRHLSTSCELDVLLRAEEALDPAGPARAARDRACALGIAHSPPPPLLLGRHLPALGVKPGPAMGRLLAQVYAHQLDGDITTHEQALETARRLWAEPAG